MAEEKPTRAGRGRPRTVDTDTLLEVARAVFLEQGVRATTLEVAQRAGLSEGAVFHRFKTKEALFRSALRVDDQEVARRVASAIVAMQGHPIHDALVHFGREMLAMGKVAIPLMMMSWSNPELLDGASPMLRDRGQYRESVAQFERYLAGQTASGALRKVEPEVFVRAFIGAIQHYTMAQLFMGEAGADEETFLRGLIDLLLEGARPRAPTA